jgi:DNA replication and repair protein RecF
LSLQQIQLVNFRSYEDATFKLDPQATLVVGPNASGKTNLLESIYVLATTKSFRARDPELIHHTANYYRVTGLTKDSELSLGFQHTEAGGTTKQASRDGVKHPLVTHLGSLGAVLFEPDDLNLLSGVPEARRRYLDSILSQTNREYAKLLNEYRRILKQRNSLLEGFAPDQIRDQIFAWDIKLATAAAGIYEQRVQLITYINERIPGFYNAIADDELPLTLHYVASVPTHNYAEAFIETLNANLMRDLAVGFTTIGPHREDFKVKFKNNNITALASRGEVRTAVLALKLAEIRYLEEQLQSKPILLLDDVFSELDQTRRLRLLHQLDGYQTLITTTDADHIVVELPGQHTVINTGAKK